MQDTDGEAWKTPRDHSSGKSGQQDGKQKTQEKGEHR